MKFYNTEEVINKESSTVGFLINQIQILISIFWYFLFIFNGLKRHYVLLLVYIDKSLIKMR